MKNKLLILLATLILGYLILISSLYWFQDNVIFQGKPLAEDHIFKFDQAFSQIEIKRTSSNDFINTLLFNPTGNSKGTILYFHGNADNMQRWGTYVVDFTKLGYQVIMIDYTGYGKTEGIPTEEVLYQNAEDVWNWAQHHLKAKNFIIYGRSLGTPIAAHLASKHKANQLILETPFYELAQDRYKFLFPFGLKYQFPTYQYLEDIDYPITIIHGTNDQVVPFSSALKLRSLLKPNDNFFIIKDGGHKNLREFEEYHKIFSNIL